MWILSLITLAGVTQNGLACLSFGGFPLFNKFARRLGKSAQGGGWKSEIPMINVPGQRFTATHGINANKGEQKLFLFQIPPAPQANYAAISANIAIAGIEGGRDKYSLYVKYGVPPSPDNYDFRSEVTGSDSYLGDKLFSHDIRIERPVPGPYYLLIVAHKSFHELLVTAIVDTPPGPEEGGVSRRGPGFTIQRMGKPHQNQNKPHQNQNKPHQNQNKPHQNQNKPHQNQNKPHQNNPHQNQYNPHQTLQPHQTQ